MEEPGRAWQYTGYRQKSRPPVQNSAQYTTTRYSTITKLVPAAARTDNSARQTAPPYQHRLPWQIFLAIPGARALLLLLSGASVLSVWNVCPDCIASLSVLSNTWAWSWLVIMVCGTGTASPSQPAHGYLHAVVRAWQQKAGMAQSVWRRWRTSCKLQGTSSSLPQFPEV